jgi:DMSO/TMAO reductase YedYZ molybdopterin-dependent catalytic subunit
MPLEALRHEITPVGLHYLLVHYDVPVVDPATWRLQVRGERTLELGLDALRERPVTTAPVTLECAGNGRARLMPRPVSQPWLHEAVGTGNWTGTPLRGVLEEAGVGDGAVDVVFSGLDRGVEGGVEQRYERALPVAEARRDDLLLAYGLNGAPLPPQHGFPLRLVVPGWYGMASVKWLSEITVADAPFTGYQHERAYRMRRDEDDPGEPVTRMEPLALLAPPGIPDFMTRERHVSAGPVRLEGRAWSGWGPIERVEVSTDGGATWADAALGTAPGAGAWTGWHHDWDAQPGSHELRCRVWDATGRGQPDEPPWNVGGYANNAAQRVAVTVTSPAPR